MPPLLPTPSELILHLDRYVRGQKRAKRDLTAAVYNHYLSQAHSRTNGADLGRHHVLLVGPTGVGKTYLVRRLAERLKVPVAFTSATSLVEVGYKGSTVESMVRTLLNRSGNDPRKAERGIIFIDEIDKIRRDETGGRDISGEGVQNALLTLLDGRLSSGDDTSSHPEVDTSRILFILAGAFVGLDGIIRERLGKGRKRIGFRATPDEDLQGVPDREVFEALCEAQLADFVSFGMIPEMMGRMAAVSVLHELSRDDLRELLSGTFEGSPLESRKALAALHGIELSVTPDALDAIAGEALALGTGARGLNRLLGRVLGLVDHRWPELADEGIRRVVIDQSCVTSGSEPRFENGAPDSEPPQRQDKSLREVAVDGLDGGDQPAESTEIHFWDLFGDPPPLPPGITNTRGWSQERIRARIGEIHDAALKPERAGVRALMWLKAFESENRNNPSVILRLCEELARRDDADLQGFFIALVHAETQHIGVALAYYDYVVLKRKIDPANFEDLRLMEIDDDDDDEDDEFEEEFDDDDFEDDGFDDDIPWGVDDGPEEDPFNELKGRYDDEEDDREPEDDPCLELEEQDELADFWAGIEKLRMF